MKQLFAGFLFFLLLLAFTACVPVLSEAPEETAESMEPTPEPEPEGSSYHALSCLPEIDYNENTVTFVLEENHATPYLWEQRILYGEECLALTEDYTAKEEHLLPSLTAGVSSAFHRFIYTWQTDGEACVVLTNMRVEGYRDGPDDFEGRRVFLICRIEDSVSLSEVPEEEGAQLWEYYA